MTRAERYERALKFGLNPPSEIFELLERSGTQAKCYMDREYNYL